MSNQDLRSFLEKYTLEFPNDVIEVDEHVADTADVAAVVWDLAARGHRELLRFKDLAGRGHDVVTNMFASRERIERILGGTPGQLHERYEHLASRPGPLQVVAAGPVTENSVAGPGVDLRALPLLTHFETDLGPYITSGIIVAEHPETGVGNLSYHRAVVTGATELATSLHSRGDLWRLLDDARARNDLLPVAMVIGAHPLFMLAASARLPFTSDERALAAGLFEEPLEVVETPTHRLRVPASAEYVLEGVIDPFARAEEGPFGEFSGYSSSRSTHSSFKVQVVLHRDEPLWVDVVGGNSDEHLNLARVPREAEMIAKLKDRFRSVRAVHYPNSGTHFHCYVAVDQRLPGEARQIILALLGWDPYLKTVVAVDDDIDLTNENEVMWALAVHLQPDRDVFVVDGLPGSLLDPSSAATGTTARMGLDATRGPDFDGVRIVINEEARARSAALVDRLLGS